MKYDRAESRTKEEEARMRSEGNVRMRAEFNGGLRSGCAE